MGINKFISKKDPHTHTHKLLKRTHQFTLALQFTPPIHTHPPIHVHSICFSTCLPLPHLFLSPLISIQNNYHSRWWEGRKCGKASSHSVPLVPCCDSHLKNTSTHLHVRPRREATRDSLCVHRDLKSQVFKKSSQSHTTLRI